MTPNLFFFSSLNLPFSFLSCSASTCSRVRTGCLGPCRWHRSLSWATGLCVDQMGQPVARLVPFLLLLLPQQGGESHPNPQRLQLFSLGGMCVEGLGPGFQDYFLCLCACLSLYQMDN